MSARLYILLAFVAVTTALPTDPVISKLDPEGLRYSYLRSDDGIPHLVDTWVKVSDLVGAPRYDPDTDNEYHLFTRANPSVSQPLVEHNEGLLLSSNYDPSKRTAILIHGFLGHIVSAFNTVLVPAFLASGDVNVIVVDWGAGATWGLNALESGRSTGRVLRWISQVTGANVADFHIVGYSVGGHSAGMVGRTLLSEPGFVAALDPAVGWLPSQQVRPSDAVYVEVMHTNIGNIGHDEPLGHVDFYPNGGVNQPGCNTGVCDHYRSYFFWGESLASGGFIGRECATYEDAINHTCTGSGRLEMGGLVPKTGARGIYYLRTNPSPPFARGDQDE